MHIETEIKFRVPDLNALAARLTATGFTLITPRAFESNTLYDTAERALRLRTEVLRIRTYAGRTVLTHKRMPPPGPNSDPTQDAHKHRIETETEVADGDSLAQVFRSIGLLPSFRYEKWRAEYACGPGHCVIDETPIGNYAELEGPDDWIDRVAPLLGVAPQDYITLSYGRLFELWRAQHGSTANDLTFDAIAYSAAI